MTKARRPFKPNSDADVFQIDPLFLPQSSADLVTHRGRDLEELDRLADVGRRYVEHGKKGGREKKTNSALDVQMAREFLEHRATSRRSDTELMTEVGKAHHMGKTTAIAAIKRGREILSRNPQSDSGNPRTG